MSRKVLAAAMVASAAVFFAAADSALAAVRVTQAAWSGVREQLSVTARDGNGSRILIATYDGEKHAMTYVRAKRAYVLTLAPVCYDPTVSISSSSGASATYAVAVSDGSTAGKQCAAPCPDADGDGFPSASCGGTDCNDGDASVHPGAADVCGDGIDQDCTGGDLACTGGDHAALRFADYPAACIGCHPGEAADMQQSLHYQWLGEAPDMVNGAGLLQGKLTNALNSYCINIKGNWSGCGACHVGRGKRPDDPSAGTENVDCLVCHSEEYASARVRLADGTMGVAAPTDSMVRNLHLPTRTTCLLCHAKAGGGDGVKRGDLSMATATNTNPAFDVHMNRGESDLPCQSCHVFRNHRVIGKGSDLRATDDISRGSEIRCASCHAGKDLPGGHSTDKIGDHVARVACQTCHIPTYAKVATEVRRDWRAHANGSTAFGSDTSPGHPWTEKAANLVPSYLFWNRRSDNALLGDNANLTYDAERGTFPTSRPLGSIDDSGSKLYPFKYKTAVQPMADNGQLIALDTGEYLKRSGNVETAIQQGLDAMGLPGTSYTWVTTDTFQLLNHGVAPAEQVLPCSACHGSTSRMDLVGQLGYGLKDDPARVCVQCHSRESMISFTSLHEKHVTSKGYDCSWCHTFSRPERGLRTTR